MGYTLRNYQSDCVNAIDTDGAEGRHLVALATGLGKSVVFSQLNYHHSVPEKWIQCRLGKPDALRRP